jgi:hypothetical protein
MLDKKYLIANGCSFTEGHALGNEGAWPKFLGEKLNMEVINLGKGGSGNDTIMWRTIEFSETNKDIAKNGLYVIQLTECLRYQVYCDNLVDEPNEWHVTPLCFQRNMDAYKNGNVASKWIYKNRDELFFIYNNITFALYKTLQNIISLVSYFEANGYPYIIFDGINDHKPFKYGESYYLKESNSNNINPEFKIKTSLDVYDSEDYYKSIVKRDGGYFIDERLIESIFNNPKIFKKIPVLLKYFINKGDSEYGYNQHYFEGNQGHPNVEACQIWSDILKEYIEETFGKSK